MVEKEGKGEKAPKGFEEKLDLMADRITASMSEAAKRIEEAFEKGKESLKESKVVSEKYRNIFSTPAGGLLLVILGFAWLLYTVGAFDHPIFPLVVIIIGLYLMLRKKGD